jgi:hypothetical protein
MANESGCRPSPSNYWSCSSIARQLVKREEICQKLWFTDTFVDFDHSLGTAINRDSRGSQRFRRGTSLRRPYAPPRDRCALRPAAPPNRRPRMPAMYERLASGGADGSRSTLARQLSDHGQKYSQNAKGASSKRTPFGGKAGRYAHR